MNQQRRRHGLQQLVVARVPGQRGIADEYDQVRFGHSPAGNLHPRPFDLVVARSQARRVNQFDRPAVDGGQRRDGVACRAGLFVNDGPLVAQQGVDQAALADVGRSGQDDSPRFGEMEAEAGKTEQALQGGGRAGLLPGLNLAGDRCQLAV